MKKLNRTTNTRKMLKRRQPLSRRERLWGYLCWSFWWWRWRWCW